MTFIKQSNNEEHLNNFFQKDGALSSVAENTPMSEKLISDDKSIGATLNRKSTPPTTPSTVSCNSPDVVFATPDVNMEHDESEIEESDTYSSIESQLDHTLPDKASNHPSVTAVSAGVVSPDSAFKFPTREAPPELDFFEPTDSETVNDIIAGKYWRGHLMPPPISSKSSVPDLVQLSQSFQDKMAKYEHEIEQEIEQEIRLATYSEEAPAKEESSKPTDGLADEVRVFSRSTEELNHMLEKWSITSLSPTDNCGTDVEVSLLFTTDEKCESFHDHAGSCAGIETCGVKMGESEELIANVEHAKSPGQADRDPFAISEMAYGDKDEERNIIVDRGEVRADSQAGHTAIDALNESGDEMKVSPWSCFSHFDDCTDPRADSESETSEVNGTKHVDSDSLVFDSDSLVFDSFIAEEVSPWYRFSHFDDCIDPRADSESETSELNGTKYVDSDSIISRSIITEESSSWWDEEEKSSGTNSIEGPPEDVNHIISYLRAAFAKVGRELDQSLNCMSDGKGIKSVDSDSTVPGFVTEYSYSTWDDEEKSRGTKDAKYMPQDLVAKFAKVGSKLGQRLNFSDYSQSKYHGHMKATLPNPGENTMDAPWLSPSGDFYRTISRSDYYSLSDDESTQEYSPFSLMDITIVGSSSKSTT